LDFMSPQHHYLLGTIRVETIPTAGTRLTGDDTTLAQLLECWVRELPRESTPCNSIPGCWASPRGAAGDRAVRATLGQLREDLSGLHTLCAG
jgi:hypothetical protein